MAIFRPSLCGGIPEGGAAAVAASAVSVVFIAATLVVPQTTADINDRRPVALLVLLLLFLFLIPINDVADGASVSLALWLVSTALNTDGIRLPLCCSCRTTNDFDNDDDDDADNDRIEKASQEYGWLLLLLLLFLYLFSPPYQQVDTIKLHNPSVSNKNTLASFEVVVLDEDILIVVGCAIISITTNKYH